MAKKTNPRKIPVTQADLKRAVDDAATRAFRLSNVLFMTVLLDKFDFDIDQLNEAWKALNKLSDEVLEKRVSVHDLKMVLKTEYYINVDEK